jgi:hypothetical protein
MGYGAVMARPALPESGLTTAGFEAEAGGVRHR